jgi:hypothetical protein
MKKYNGNQLKKLFITLLVSAISSMTLANINSLECKNNYPLFNKVFSETTEITKKNDIKDYLAHMKKYNYSSLFDKNHPNKIFNGYKWQSINELEQDAQALEEGGWTPPTSEEFLPIKENFILSKKEICVIPYLYRNVDEKAEIESSYVTDIIWIRDLDSTIWRYLDIEDESNKYLNEFIPDFPKNIKLISQ